MEFNWDLFNAVALHVQNDRNDELFASFDASRNFHLSDSAIRIYCSIIYSWGGYQHFKFNHGPLVHAMFRIFFDQAIQAISKPCG